MLNTLPARPDAQRNCSAHTESLSACFDALLGTTEIGSDGAVKLIVKKDYDELSSTWQTRLPSASVQTADGFVFAYRQHPSRSL